MISNLEQFASRGLKAQQAVDGVLASLQKEHPFLFSALTVDEIEVYLRSKTPLPREDVDAVMRKLREKGAS
jgi:hypothetical protein